MSLASVTEARNPAPGIQSLTALHDRRQPVSGMPGPSSSKSTEAIPSLTDAETETSSERIFLHSQEDCRRFPEVDLVDCQHKPVRHRLWKVNLSPSGVFASVRKMVSTASLVPTDDLRSA